MIDLAANEEILARRIIRLKKECIDDDYQKIIKNKSWLSEPIRIWTAFGTLWSQFVVKVALTGIMSFRSDSPPPKCYDKTVRFFP